MRPVLKHKKDYGSFDHEMFVPKVEKYKDTETRQRSSASSQQFLQRKETQPFVIQKKVSYALEPTYPSDIGMSDADAMLSDDEKEKELKVIKEQKRESRQVKEEKYVVEQEQEAVLPYDDDGYFQDDDEYFHEEYVGNGMNGHYHELAVENMNNEIATDCGLNGNECRSSVSSWFMECDLKFCAPLRNLFSGRRGDNQYTVNEPYYDDHQYDDYVYDDSAFQEPYQNGIGTQQNQPTDYKSKQHGQNGHTQHTNNGYQQNHNQQY